MKSFDRKGSQLSWPIGHVGSKNDSPPELLTQTSKFSKDPLNETLLRVNAMSNR